MVSIHESQKIVPVLTLEREIRKQSYIFRTLFTLRQFGKDQETSPSTSLLGPSYTLQSNRQRIQETLTDSSSLHDTHRPNVFISNIDPRQDNTSREDPFSDIEVNLGLNLARPFIERQQIDGGKGVDTVDRDRDEERTDEICVCERWEAAGVFEIVQTLGRG